MCRIIVLREYSYALASLNLHLRRIKVQRRSSSFKIFPCTAIRCRWSSFITMRPLASFSRNISFSVIRYSIAFTCSCSIYDESVRISHGCTMNSIRPPNFSRNQNGASSGTDRRKSSIEISCSEPRKTLRDRAFGLRLKILAMRGKHELGITRPWQLSSKGRRRTRHLKPYLYLKSIRPT